MRLRIVSKEWMGQPINEQTEERRTRNCQQKSRTCIKREYTGEARRQRKLVDRGIAVYKLVQ